MMVMVGFSFDHGYDRYLSLIGICIIGDFSVNPPNETALNAVRLWMACGIERKHVVKDNYIITHRQSQRPGYTVW